jgi:hypothetical protein
MSSRMAWRTAGKVGLRRRPVDSFFPALLFEPAILEESVGDHRHERMTMQALPGDVGVCRGEGQYLIDRQGTRYLDLMSG